MGLLAFLADRAPQILLRAAAIGFAALALVAYSVEPGVIVFVCGMVALANLCALVLDYLRRRGFYAELRRTEEALGKNSFLTTELMGEPHALEARLHFESLETESHAMRDAVAAARNERREYAQYIETWVHEIKTPIAAAHLVAHNNPGPATEQIAAELDAVEGYVEQALYYARGTSLDRDFQIRELELADVVRDALRRHARTLIGAHMAPELGVGLDAHVRADAKWLTFVLGQLLVNAAKYRKPGNGPCSLRIWAEQVPTGPSTHETRLCVADAGIGIPASDVGRVFDRGFTGENGRRFARSTGMGLYLVRELCHKTGLSVDLASTEGQGTTVTISFPA